MTSSSKKSIRAIICLFTASMWIELVWSSSMSAQCNVPRPANTYTFLHDLNRRCSLSISSSMLTELDGESLEQVLSSSSINVYTAVLFYDSASPFSSDLKSIFIVLSSMFPQISHIAVGNSLVMPSLFSRYGVHSLPALFIVNQAEKMRYYGPKDLHSLARFYRKTTGLDPIEYQACDDTIEIYQSVIQPWYQSSWKDIMVKEPYLVFAIVFLVLRAFLCFCPDISSCIRTLWVWSKSRMSLGLFGESSQLLGRALHLIDVERVWSKMKLCKTRNFQKGARSAHVWASSLASVSLGEASSRPSSSVES